MRFRLLARATGALLVPLLAPPLLGGCAPARTDYPSLALRPAERPDHARASAQEALALVDTSPLDAASRARLDDAVARARSAHQRFLAALPATRRAVAAGARAGIDSDAYAAAQIALGNLQTLGSGTVFALADIDALLVERSNAMQGTEEVGEARSQITALVAQQRTALAPLETALR
ncbi:hypothetical protein EYB45_05290 [Erythrobacteraceae bacterium CFH 75059]|uniref:hypothetical protein n=1 Tax=Qipengyuania thermophila TaxID=2509361 RepID=UPI0010201A08|nr:hypothetical protein [Qipengyuania thermophila]TCD04949.1 hypothetical protein EYB45_05290 [Erythrobacteraceae bacterium CFH 75059]